MTKSDVPKLVEWLTDENKMYTYDVWRGIASKGSVFGAAFEPNAFGDGSLERLTTQKILTASLEAFVEENGQ